MDYDLPCGLNINALLKLILWHVYNNMINKENSTTEKKYVCYLYGCKCQVVRVFSCKSENNDLK